MIRNEAQLAHTEKRLLEFQKAVVEGDEEAAEVYGELIAELQGDIREYKAVRDNYTKSFEIKAIEDIGRALTMCRVSRHMTQEQLAVQLGMKQQQLQRYEADFYAQIPLWRLAEISEVLEVELNGCIRPCKEEPGGWIPGSQIYVSGLLPYATGEPIDPNVGVIERVESAT